MEDAPDGRRRRDGHALALEVPCDGHGSGVEAGRGQLAAQPDDPVPYDRRRLLRTPARAARPRLEMVQASLPVPRQEAVQVLAADPVLRRCGGDGQLRCDDPEDSHPMLRHGRDCHRCPDSPVADQVSPMSWIQTLSQLPTPCSNPGTRVPLTLVACAPDLLAAARMPATVKSSKPLLVPACNPPAPILAVVGLCRRRIRRLPV